MPNPGHHHLSVGKNIWDAGYTYLTIHVFCGRTHTNISTQSQRSLKEKKTDIFTSNEKLSERRHYIHLNLLSQIPVESISTLLCENLHIFSFSKTLSLPVHILLPKKHPKEKKKTKSNQNRLGSDSEGAASMETGSRLRPSLPTPSFIWSKRQGSQETSLHCYKESRYFPDA